MKKIDKKQFINQILSGKEDNPLPKKVLPIKNDSIKEFKVKRKFIYCVNGNENLVDIHNRLLNNFLNQIPLSKPAIAFRKNLSYLDLFEPHKNNYYFMRLDIKDFFHSITEELISDRFETYFENEFFDEVKTQRLLQSFINLVTYTIPTSSENEKHKGKKVLPIGFKTSPSISNIVFRKLDIIITKYCSDKNITYTRYADDMLFSSNSLSTYLHSDHFFNEIKYLLSMDGFKLNDNKTLKSTHSISLNGYLIESNKELGEPGNIRISNKKTIKIEKILYELKKGKSKQEVMTKFFGFTISPDNFKYFPPKQSFIERYCHDQLLNKLLGFRSYLISIIRFNEKFDCVNNQAIKKYTNIISELNEYTDSIQE